tara:strand:- start:898 stop:1251 length:354 start_codon:yes stop_codon:yes gene_type:complete
MNEFGQYIKQSRETKLIDGKKFSLRLLSRNLNIEPSYLSKIERGVFAPPSEELINKIAIELELDNDVLLALAGKVSTELKEIIQKRPALFAELIRQLKDTPDNAILKVVRTVRDGNW